MRNFLTRLFMKKPESNSIPSVITNASAGNVKNQLAFATAMEEPEANSIPSVITKASAGNVKNQLDFAIAMEKYQHHESKSEANLAICYLNGIGVKKDPIQAFDLLVEGGFNGSTDCMQLLGDCFYSGDIGQKNLLLAQYIYNIAEGKNPLAIYQYKAMTPTTFTLNKKSEQAIFSIETEHLSNVISSILRKIDELRSGIVKIDSETWWMDRDQLNCWRETNYQNINIQNGVSRLANLKNSPYYARMDSSCTGSVQTHYIGEEAYFDSSRPECNVVSVWSEYGKRYRALNEVEFNINGYVYEVLLRRRFNIKNGELHDVFEDFSYGSVAANARITDPYLLKILEEKKGETNITNIIRTIQQNQNAVIEFDFNKSFILQGCAGSGKTMILLHRLANIKYNLPSTDFTRVKIITPNTQFKFFIDELSKNLKIQDIEKMTLSEYYVYLLDKYRNEHQELLKETREVTVKGKHINQEIEVWKKTGPSQATELKGIEPDSDLSFDIVSKVYTSAFSEILVRYAIEIKNSASKSSHYGNVINLFKDVFPKALKEINVDKKLSANYQCVLYSKLLFAYVFYGRIGGADSLLCIDEGQDISRLQYTLLNKVNGGTVKFNIYGDIDQQIPQTSGLEEWSQISNSLKCEMFMLNENYRNSDEIITFYNKQLGINNRSFGLKTKPVKIISVQKLLTGIKFQLLLKNRTAIITNNKEMLSPEILELCSSEVVSIAKVSLLSVRQAKGLEFDSVFVIDSSMSKNERYIAFSRALSELYIVNENA